MYGVVATQEFSKLLSSVQIRVLACINTRKVIIKTLLKLLNDAFKGDIKKK